MSELPSFALLISEDEVETTPHEFRSLGSCSEVATNQADVLKLRRSVEATPILLHMVVVDTTSGGAKACERTGVEFPVEPGPERAGTCFLNRPTSMHATPKPFRLNGGASSGLGQQKRFSVHGRTGCGHRLELPIDAAEIARSRVQQSRLAG